MRRGILYWRIWLAMAAFLIVSGPARGEDTPERKRNREEFSERGKVRRWGARPWSSAYQTRTQNYTIKTDTTFEVARYIGDLMEMAARCYREIFDCASANIPNLPINAYATQAKYDEQAEKVGFASGVTSGFYSPAGSGTIHLLFQNVKGVHPSVTLFHEGTHQFVHYSIDFKLPLGLKPLVPEERHLLVSTPLWLNEGLATYMETAYYNGESLEIGRVNVGRLRQLQEMLRRRINPSVVEVVSRRYGQPFGTEHYAVAWGLVYSLRHNRMAAVQTDNRRRLSAYLAPVRKGFFDNPQQDFSTAYLKGGKLPEDFDLLWNTRLGEKSLEWFKRLISGDDVEAWEKKWTEFILGLNSRLPYGGTLTTDNLDETTGGGL